MFKYVIITTDLDNTTGVIIMCKNYKISFIKLKLQFFHKSY